MKKIFITIFLIIALLLIFILVNKTHSPNVNETVENNMDKSSVTYNGWLHTNGAKLENEQNENIQLHGLSSHGIEWFSDVITYESLENLKNNWSINVFRIAMYTDSNGSGYIYNKSSNKQTVDEIINMAIKLDMYVIVDWHILSDNNPQTHIEDAQVFFEEISSKYAHIPNVIYEICNEPNGTDVTWDRDIKPYAEKIIPIIRNNSENSLIIVGTPDWCKNLTVVADNPLIFKNVVYSCHFYAGTHGQELREKINYCINKNIPIFVSECGLTKANGDGEVFFDKFSEWISYLNSNNISWVYWSFSNKNESSAILKPEYVSYTFSENNSVNAHNTSSDLTNNINSTTNNYYNSEHDNVTNEDFKNVYNKHNDINYNNTTSSSLYTTSDNSNTKYVDFNDYLSESGKFIKGIFKSYKK